jgi:hypothetical protein
LEGVEIGWCPRSHENQAQILFSFLKGATPILRDTPDSRGWGTTGYLVKYGYNTLLYTLRVFKNSTKWKNVWSQDSLPKTNFFIWSLTHGKILTGENLMKIGFHGHFNCPLCQISQDNIQHLFWDYPFSRKVWNMAFGDLSRQIRWPSDPNPSLGNWEKYYQGSFRENQSLNVSRGLSPSSYVDRSG